jgi:hypothetical protein
MSEDHPKHDPAHAPVPLAPSIMNKLVAASLRQPLLIFLVTVILIGAGIALARPPAGGCLSRSFAADGRDHHPMARPRRRGSGAADHRARRAG